MLPEQPTIAIPGDLSAVRVLRSELTQDRTLLIEVESTLTTTTCRRCGQTIRAFYGYDRPLLLRHLPSFGYGVAIRTVCPERWQGYVGAVQAVRPRAAVVIDRFHVAQQ